MNIATDYIYISVNDNYYPTTIATNKPLEDWQQLQLCFPDPIGELHDDMDEVDYNNYVPSWRDDNGDVVFIALPYGWGLDEIDNCPLFPHSDCIDGLLDILT